MKTEEEKKSSGRSSKEDRRRKEEDEIQKKQAESEGFILEGVQKEKKQTKKRIEGLRTETLEGQDPTDQ